MILIIVGRENKDGCIEPIGPIAESALIKVRHRLGPDQETQVIVNDYSARIDAQRRVRDLRLGGCPSCRVFLYFYILYLFSSCRVASKLVLSDAIARRGLLHVA